MKREITEIKRETIDYDANGFVGYLVGGELTTVELSDDDKENFAGDWSVISEGDIYSMTDNLDCRHVHFHGENGQVTSYYRRADDTFTVVAWQTKPEKLQTLLKIISN